MSTATEFKTRAMSSASSQLIADLRRFLEVAEPLTRRCYFTSYEWHDAVRLTCAQAHLLWSMLEALEEGKEASGGGHGVVRKWHPALPLAASR